MRNFLVNSYLLLLGVLVGLAAVGGGFMLLARSALERPFQAEGYLDASSLGENLKYRTDRPELKSPVTLLFAGDVMLSRAVGEKMRQRGDYRWPFLKIADLTRQADILFGNLEGPISARGRRVGSRYSFRAEPQVAEGLKLAGFDVLSVANNHIGDYGREAMEDTFFILNKNGIKITGGGYNERETYQSTVIAKQATIFAFLAYTTLGPQWTESQGENLGITFYSKERMKQDIEKAKKRADIVIVSFHFGDEYNTQPSPLQKRAAQSAIEAGADLVVGHHPHVVQPIEKYKSGYIAYSLGNFIFDQTFSQATMEGALLKVIVKDKQIQKIESIKTKITPEFQVISGSTPQPVEALNRSFQGGHLSDL